MANIMDYLDWRGDITFEQSPFNEVDNYILCKLGCPDFTGIVPENGEMSIAEAVEKYFAEHGDENPKLGLLISPHVIPMIRRLPQTRRFGELRVSDFVNQVDPQKVEQFSALTIELPDGVNYVTFRGTDDTILAWKEDFLLSTEDAVSAQEDAVAYLLRQAVSKEGPLMVGGHSKGGNLAVYSVFRAPEAVQNRVLAIYNNDGPGFRHDLSDSREYAEIRPKIRTIVPQHTMVGNLLYHESNCTIVKANQTGMQAHDGFTWEVLGTQFVRCEDYSLGSRAFEKAAMEMARQMDTDERRAFIEELFSVLTSTGAVTLTDLTENKMRQAVELAQGMRKSSEVRKFFQNMLSLMIKETVSNAHIKVPKLKLRVKREPENIKVLDQ